MSEEEFSPQSETETLMPPSPARATHLSTSLNRVLSTIRSAPRPPNHRNSNPPRLVLVSKLKPANDILHLHSPSPPQPTEPSHPSQSHFGENYFQELLSKSLLLPRSINWHFIGALQSNKCRPMAEQIPNLWAVESVDSLKKAKELEKGRAALADRLANRGMNGDGKKEGEDKGGGKYGDVGGGEGGLAKLNIFIQINTSSEPTKSGLPSSTTPHLSPSLLDLARYINSQDSCPHLHLRGLMTIGAIARSQSSPLTTEKEKEDENEDFETLVRVRDELAKELGEGVELELSMGMSADYESAIRCGSDEVRVGSTVFGERPSKQDAKVKEDVVEEKG
ncbi:MAG: hypothetical protein LQ350_002843 [Teloschistes chrysophthalmus]|nr:MAG: hypothetical protein LQ350_002843 [Niorma chrysophthalma]